MLPRPQCSLFNKNAGRSHPQLAGFVDVTKLTNVCVRRKHSHMRSCGLKCHNHNHDQAAQNSGIVRDRGDANAA